MNRRKNILVAMSGGVDSSVAAALLLDAGHDVSGAFMIHYKEHDEHGLPCYMNDYRDAVRVAAKLGIPLLKWDFSEQYKTLVLDYLYAEYKAGRTPNPDVLCNQFIKFGVWLEGAREQKFDALATGHYARIGERRAARDTSLALKQARDSDKDQTYFLHRLGRDQLRCLLFPLGEYTKAEVRGIACEKRLPVAKKEESMGICFVGEVPIKEFLQKKLSKVPGEIIKHDSGAVIGHHDGLSFYTIGQRHGFEQSGGDRPLFVVDKDFEHNRLVVGDDDDPLLYKTEIRVSDMHWISGQAPGFPLQCEGRFRHRQALQTITVNSDARITCDYPQRAITPGQFAVLYKDGVCLGGGVIAA